jgi:hypothetical protein
MKKLLFIVLLLLCLIAVPYKGIGAEEIVQADLVIEYVRVFTMDKANEEAEAVAVKNGKFVYVGDREGVQAYKGPQTRVMYMDNRLMLPGFIDGHNAAYLKAEKMFWLDLSSFSTFEEYEKAIFSYRAQHPQLKQLCAVGWNQKVTEEAWGKSGKTPRDLIDQLVHDIPFVAFSAHRDELWVNSKTLEISGLDHIEHGLTETGEASGIIPGQFTDMVVQVLPQPDFSVEQYKKALIKYQEDAARYGITAAFVPLGNHSENVLKAFDELDRKNLLTMTYELGIYVDPLKDLDQIELFKEWREIYQGKNYSVQTAKMNYTENAVWEKEKFLDMLDLLDREGFRIHVEAEKELHMIFEGFEYARVRNGKKNFKHVISHMPIVTNDDLTNFRKFRIIPSVQPAIFHQSIDAGKEDELKNWHRMKSYFEKGLPVSSFSNFPDGELNPLYGIETGMTRLHWNDEKSQKPLWPKESATLKQMLRSYTIYAARQIGREAQLGKIRVGMQADFIILDKNIFRVPPGEISEAKVILTYFKGKETYRDESEIGGQ